MKTEARRGAKKTREAWFPVLYRFETRSWSGFRSSATSPRNVSNWYLDAAPFAGDLVTRAHNA